MAFRQGITGAWDWKRFFASWMTWTLWLGIVAFATYFSWLSDIKASNFDAHNHDLSHMWQSVWNVAHGHGFEFSLTGDHINVPRLAVHADYFLILLAPLSWVWPHFLGLLVFQASGIAIGAWLVMRIAQRWTGHRGVSYALGWAYLLYGPLQFSILWQFHAVTLAMPLALAAVEALIYRRRSGWVWLWFILALTTKEQVGLILGPLLWFVARWSGRRKFGWWLAGSGVVYSLLHFAVIIPAWRDSGNSHFVWEFYYGSLGATLPEQLQHLLQPGELARRLIVPNHFKNAFLLLVPFAFLPLLAPVSLLALVAIGPHWLSDNSSQQSLLRVNHVLAMVVLVVATIHASKTVLQRGWVSPRWLAAVIIGAGVIGSLIISPLPWSMYVNPATRTTDSEVAVMRQQHQPIPTSAIVGYSRGAGAEFRDREYAWLLPAGIADLDYAVVFTSKQSSQWERMVDQDRRLNEFFRSTPAFTPVYTQGRLSIYRRDHTVVLPTIPNLELLPAVQ